MFDKLPLKALKHLIKEYQLSTKIILSALVNGKRKTKTKKELAEELHKHLEIRESDGEIIMKEHKYGKLPETKSMPKPKPKPVAPKPVAPKPVAPEPVINIPEPVEEEKDEKDDIDYENISDEVEDLIWEYIDKKSPVKLPHTAGLKKTIKQIKKTDKPFYDGIIKEATTLINFFPPKIKKKTLKLEKGFKFIDELQKKGENQNIDYNARGFVTDILMLLFFEKYGANCPFKFIEFGTTNKYAINWNLGKFLRQLARCLKLGEKRICIPLSSPSHMNLLIINVDSREIIRFEPHGNAVNTNVLDKKDVAFNDFCIGLTRDINIFLQLKQAGKRPFKFVPPTEICPKIPNTEIFKKGFQSMESLTESGGFCQLWSMFFMECVLRNPDMDIKDIYSQAYDAMKLNPKYFSNVVKGYYIQVNELLKDTNFFQKSIIGKELKLIHNQTFYDKFYKYIKEINKENEKKPQIPFTGEGFKLPKIYR